VPQGRLERLVIAEDLGSRAKLEGLESQVLLGLMEQRDRVGNPEL